ncbi:MAG: ATP-binding protein [Bacteroidota bacterium]
MSKISFKISARTAKLIGRENFSSAEGAIIELVKNCYDADAGHCFVIQDIPYQAVPQTLSLDDFEAFSSNYMFIKSAYKWKKGVYSLSEKREEQLDVLKDFFLGLNAIYIVDNGHGMSRTSIENYWMEIGTENKELNYVSVRERVKTGAKGIGRFALDRLGYKSELWTVGKAKKNKGAYWKMDWKQFDQSNKRLDEIEADLEETVIDLKSFLLTTFLASPHVLSQIKGVDFKSGTIIKISNLRDIWREEDQVKVFKSLEELVPPKELQIGFNVAFFSLQQPKLFGQIDSAFVNDFDYRVDANYHSSTSQIDLTFVRNELELSEVKKNFASVFKGQKAPYNIQTLQTKKFTFGRSAFELLKWEKDKLNESRLHALGDFSFSFYFLKNSQSKDYPYKDFNAGERQKVLKKFGGIKIYRDSFRVRPYGDIGNDWLKLGERSAASPAGAGQRIGDWRVGPNQIIGSVTISRIKNPNLVDKSDRSSLIENDSFGLLKSIVTGIIAQFELDRSVILNKFYNDIQEKKEKQRELEIQAEAEKLADKIIEERERVEEQIYGNKQDLFKSSKQKAQKDSFRKIIELSFQKFEKPESQDAEIAQVRNLASLGLIVSSFAHELRQVKNNSNDIHDLEGIFVKLVSDADKKTIDFQDGINIIETLKSDSEKIAHWVEYSLSAIKKDKRKRASLKFSAYFGNLAKQWGKVLSDRNIRLSIADNISVNYHFRAFEMDMNTIFSNLISNSIDAFNRLEVVRRREISISVDAKGKTIEVFYSDNGIGLPKVFEKNKEEVFLPFTTSKKDKDGNDVGTGLGMYLVKNVVNDNNGEVQILDSKEGFKLKILFPLREK